MIESKVTIVRGFPRSMGYNCSTCSLNCCASCGGTCDEWTADEFQVMQDMYPQVAALAQEYKSWVRIPRARTGCMFLNNGLCEIHRQRGLEYKPLCCRAYPILFAEFGSKVLSYMIPCANTSVISDQPVTDEEIAELHEMWLMGKRRSLYGEGLYARIKRQPGDWLERIESLQNAFTLYEREKHSSLQDYLGCVWRLFSPEKSSELDNYYTKTEKELQSLPLFSRMSSYAAMSDDALECLYKILHHYVFGARILQCAPRDLILMVMLFGLAVRMFATGIAAKAGRDADARDVLMADNLVEFSTLFQDATRKATPLLLSLRRLYVDYQQVGYRQKLHRIFNYMSSGGEAGSTSIR